MRRKRPRPPLLAPAEDLGGKRFLVLGEIAHWPAVLGRNDLAAFLKGRGARLARSRRDADFVVMGEGRARGRDAAPRRALAAAGEGGPRVLEERDFLHLVRPEVAGRRFFVAGALGLPEQATLLADAGAVVVPDPDQAEVVVVAERRAKGRAASLRRVEARLAAGEPLLVLDEEAFLELLACLRPPRDERYDVRSLVLHLRSLVDPRRVERALRMLKREAFHLYVEAKPTSVGGIVRSQRDRDAYYACWIDAAGRYACYDRDLASCLGQDGEICKHVIVLMVGLAGQGTLDPRQAHAWAQAASRRRPEGDSEPSALLVLRYRGALAGDLDWRPTETVPEDYYTL